MSARKKDEACIPCDAAVAPYRPGGFGFRIALSLVLAGQGMVFSLGYNNAFRAGEAPAYGSLPYVVIHASLALSAAVVMALLGGPLFRELWRALRRGRVSVESLFLLSGLGAWIGSALSSWRGTGSLYYEVVSIVLCVYAIGKQVGAVQRGRLGAALAAFRQTFDRAQVVRCDGTVAQVSVPDLGPGDRVRVSPGEPVPVDGVIEEGSGYVRETALTGEPTPVSRGAGEALQAGSWSVDGVFLIRPILDRPRQVESLMRLLEQQPERPSRLQEVADQLMQAFVPFTALVSLGTFIGWWWGTGAVWDALFNAMAVLLVACPCALGLAMPSGLWAGLYYLSQHGLVGRHGRLLDVLAHADTLVFDKTGTLTEFEEEADPSRLDAGERAFLTEAVRSLALSTRHPVSGALARLPGMERPVSGVVVHPGRGLEGCVSGRSLIMGEAALLQAHGVALPPLEPFYGKPIHVALEGRYAGCLILRERVRTETIAALEALEALGCRCLILSGDPQPAMDRFGDVAVEGGLSAQRKADTVRALQREGRRVVFVGDGVNDLEAMQCAEAALAIDAGVALATESADGVLLGGRIGTLPFAIRKARLIRQHLTSNLRFALSYNLVGMALAAGGFLHPVVAALLMVGSSLWVTYRALRTAALA